MEEKKKKIIIFLVIIALLVLVDQVTKFVIVHHDSQVIPNVLNFTTVENKGGAFGVGQNSTSAFIITNIVVLGIIARFLLMQDANMDKKTKVALCLIFAGGFSNVIDRIFRGFVADFIDFTPLIRFPVFNLADAYIAMGFVLLAIFLIGYTYRNVKKKKIQEENKES